MKDVLVKEKIFSHSIEKVWKAISQGEEISKWFIHADFKPEVGYKYTFTATEEHGGTKVRGKVLSATPYHLSYTWIVGDAGIETTVSWKLEESDGKTKLLLEHSGMSHLPQEAATEMIGHFEQGWKACLDGLTKYFNNENTGPAH